MPEFDVRRGVSPVLVAAGERVGLSMAGARLIRHGTNELFEVSAAVVARIGPAGTADDARRQVLLARRLCSMGMAVVEPVDELEQPVVVDDQPVTWWVRLPEHRPATPGELGTVLRQLHSVPLDGVGAQGEVDPFEGMDASILDSPVLVNAERVWLRRLVSELRVQYGQIPPALPKCVVHGDAWQGNVAVIAGRPPVLLDLDRSGVGRPEWDLTVMAVDHADFSRIGEQDYAKFVDAYGGFDVTEWDGFRTFATLWELRWLFFVLRKAHDSAAALREARHRIACLAGEVERPWTWSAF